MYKQLSPSLLIKILTWVSITPVALVVSLTFVDVFARYLISMPVKGSVEIIEHAMAVLIFSSLPIVTHNRGHVTVSLIDGLFSGAAKIAQKTFCDLISASALGLLTWRLAVQGFEDLDGSSPSVVLGLPQAPLVFAMSIMSLVATLLALALALGNFSCEETAK